MEKWTNKGTACWSWKFLARLRRDHGLHTISSKYISPHNQQTQQWLHKGPLLRTSLLYWSQFRGSSAKGGPDLSGKVPTGCLFAAASCSSPRAQARVNRQYLFTILKAERILPGLLALQNNAIVSFSLSSSDFILTQHTLPTPSPSCYKSTPNIISNPYSTLVLDHTSRMCWTTQFTYSSCGCTISTKTRLCIIGKYNDERQTGDQRAVDRNRLIHTCIISCLETLSSLQSCFKLLKYN